MWTIPEDDDQHPKVDGLLPDAEQGDREAQYLLGSCYFYGRGGVVGEDCAKASVWYTRAAEQGSGKAMHMLGDCDADKEEWYERAIPILLVEASEQGGDAESQFCLGWSYEMGSGVEKDCKLAFHWYQLAAKQGHGLALEQLGDFYQHGTGGIEMDLVHAIHAYRLAEEKGSPCSAYCLDSLLERVQTKQNELVSHIESSFLSDDSHPAAGLWPLALARLGSHRPAGFSPVHKLLQEQVVVTLEPIEK